MIIMGIDQGLANIGYSVIDTSAEAPKLLTHGIITTKPDPVFGNRLILIKNKLSEIIDEFNPNLICTEALYCNPAQRSGRNKSAAIVQTNMATGIIFLLGAEKNVPIKQFVPISVKKKITGSGKATKEEVEKKVKEILLEDVKFKKDHDADATAIALTGYLAEENHRAET